MICEVPRPIFGGPYDVGLKKAIPRSDGYTVYLQWGIAIQSEVQDEIGYNVYFSTLKDDVLTEGPKYFTRYSELFISRFSPGDTIYFLVRAMEYNPLDLSPLSYPVSPQATNAFSYPESALSSNISASDLLIPLIDISEFPSSGVFHIGTELIKYTSIDLTGNTAVVPADGRGYYNTNARYHDVDGYDGYVIQDPTVRSYAGWEDLNHIYVTAQPRFEPPNYAYTDADGYKQVMKDNLTTDLSGSDQSNLGFPGYDYSGWHRTSMADYFSGVCIGSYHGGEQGCNGNKTRGFNLQQRSTQQLEMLLNTTGEPIVLLKRKWTGIRCNCFRLNQEHHESRCKNCFNTSFVGGYDQYYNPRKSDGRILVRFNPTNDDLAIKNYGLEQNFVVSSAWTLVIPAIKDRDVLIRFDENGEDEFRYEVTGVTRNKLMFSESGSQIMQMYRLDKTDPVYQWRAVRDTSTVPSTLNTSLSIMAGYAPHLHTITVSNSIANISQINGTTSTSQGHSHSIISGVLLDMDLSHTHTIIL